MLNRLNPRQRKIALALAAGVLLALVVVVTRRRGASGQTDQSVSTAGSTAQPPAGSTFADNGEAAAGLSTSITQGLGDVATALDAVTGNQQTIADRIDQLPTTLPVEGTPGAGDAALVAAGAAAVIQGLNSTPSGARSAAKKATSKPKPAAAKRGGKPGNRPVKKPARRTKVGTVGKTTAGLGHPSKPPAKTHPAPAKRPRKK